MTRGTSNTPEQWAVKQHIEKHPKCEWLCLHTKLVNLGEEKPELEAPTAPQDSDIPNNCASENVTPNIAENIVQDSGEPVCEVCGKPVRDWLKGPNINEDEHICIAANPSAPQAPGSGDRVEAILLGMYDFMEPEPERLASAVAAIELLVLEARIEESAWFCNELNDVDVKAFNTRKWGDALSVARTRLAGLQELQSNQKGHSAQDNNKGDK